MALVADLKAANNNINTMSLLGMSDRAASQRLLDELDNVRRGRMYAQQIADATGPKPASYRTANRPEQAAREAAITTTGVTAEQHQANVQALRDAAAARRAAIVAEKRADREAKQAAKAEAEAGKAAKKAAKAEAKAAKDQNKVGDIVNGHQLRWTGAEYVWVSVTA